MPAVSVLGINELRDAVAALPAQLNATLLNKSQSVADLLVRKIRDEKLSGTALSEKSGRLKESINSAVEDTGQGAVASVFVDGDVPYAAIQEYGGVTKAHVIEALNARALAFNRGGKASFFTRVNHPGSVIPERSYLRSAFEEMQDDIVAGFEEALQGLADFKP
jgi:phage gpG-like protein